MIKNEGERMTVGFAPPEILEDDIEAVARVLRSGWITSGPETAAFEKAISDVSGTKSTVCLNSATACLEGALRVMGIGPGDEVIVPAYTYTATAAVVDRVGAKIVMADSLPDSPHIDPKCVESLFTQRTKAVIPVDIAGIPADYSALNAIAEEKSSLFQANNETQSGFGRAVVIADAAHSLSADRDGQPVGQLADFTSYSFHAVKNVTTSEGGALTWREHPGIDSDSVIRKLRLYSRAGIVKDYSGVCEYDVEELNGVCLMTDIMAAMGLSQIKRLNEILVRRRRAIANYDSLLSTLPVIPLRHFDSGISSSAHLYMIECDGMGRGGCNALIDRMREMGVQCNIHYRPLPLMTVYRKMGFDMGDYPNAGRYYDREVTLPLFNAITPGQQEYVAECLAKAFDSSYEATS